MLLFYVSGVFSEANYVLLLSGGNFLRLNLISELFPVVRQCIKVHVTGCRHMNTSMNNISATCVLKKNC